MIEETLTEPRIDYEWWLTGPQGARFCLYPERGKHTPEDVERARRWLKHNHDVVSLQIRWKELDDKVAPPVKIPDPSMIKQLHKKIGELESFIQELEHTIQTNESAQKKQLKKEIQSEKLYKQLDATILKLTKELNASRKTVSDLITKLNK